MSTSSSRALRNRLIRLRNLRIAGEQDARTPAPTDAPDFGGRWTRRQWAQASLTATMVALLGTIVPGFASMERPPVGSPLQTLSLKLPPLSLTRASGTFGRFDTANGIVYLEGAARMVTADGYDLNADRMRADVRSVNLAADGNVVGDMPLGRITADSMALSGPEGQHHLVFKDHVRLVYSPQN